MKIKKTIGLIILTNIPDPVGAVAILQTRGKFNYEKRTPETYTSAMQISVHGSIEEDESEFEALIRETKEELGEEIAQEIEGRYGELIELNRIEKDSLSNVNFGIVLPHEFLQKVKLHPSSGGLKLLPKEKVEEITELKKSDREHGIQDGKKIAMFPDDIEAVKLAFEKLTK
ncbi:MAG: NUDIX domain-containing protein [Candidatus Pacebacteria bacterium]|jgi:8-oxo-dGTP pyrophosphatase MutT (NUDIX family)|nr:hypothetical protein [Parcubacteria group bacterium]MDP6249260.1 NUDIX domain-containing protein [Candidatus Paceibacterota bacterium]MDP7159068.1 NUDIX domain-containing protein [Candidatus Paceibacterota bacterium]MDP7367362.1 NUDIX domain-containing protein [Candidatus Paceibacterota bacterium]MDP7466118.1 NUDIX domain-containing protein [Candidatus Paceibacterota bacterium]|tara:strand:+ start:276 stop:791 length:516 start_codon:yes stop_codon:yes gene_type:complete